MFRVGEVEMCARKGKNRKEENNRATEKNKGSLTGFELTANRRPGLNQKPLPLG
jgi:hypothetical protein